MRILFNNEIIQSICNHAAVDAIYLYGSRAKNTAHKNSDWDIAVIFTPQVSIYNSQRSKSNAGKSCNVL